MNKAICFFVELAEFEWRRIKKVLQLSYVAVCKQISIKVHEAIFTSKL